MSVLTQNFPILANLQLNKLYLGATQIYRHIIEFKSDIGVNSIEVNQWNNFVRAPVFKHQSIIDNTNFHINFGGNFQESNKIF